AAVIDGAHITTQASAREIHIGSEIAEAELVRHCGVERVGPVHARLVGNRGNVSNVTCDKAVAERAGQNVLRIVVQIAQENAVLVRDLPVEPAQMLLVVERAGYVALNFPKLNRHPSSAFAIGYKQSLQIVEFRGSELFRSGRQGLQN